MAKIIAIHSFRRGTGKSTVIANLALLWAAEGRRVGMVDLGLPFSGLHTLFGLNQDEAAHSFSDYLLGKCRVEQATRNITPDLKTDLKGQLFLTASSLQRADIIHLMQSGYDVDLLGESFDKLAAVLGLDLLILDTYAGLNEESIMTITLSDTLVILLRPDQQDYQGTAITVQLAQQLEILDTVLLVNAVSASFDLEEVRAQVEESYRCPVAAALPHTPALTNLAGQSVFVLQYPDHPLTTLLREVASNLG